MNDRIKDELELLRRSYPTLEYVEAGQWVRIKNYEIPSGLGWNRQTTDVCFQIPAAYPGTPPYGFYVPAGILINATRPESYQEPAQNKPPFEGSWALFSWQVDSPVWLPKADFRAGSNLLNFVRTFKERFSGGK
ncbi:MAG: E2/UBC family protein [Candidatus Bathyarchaeia archaeon]|jgi:hypothetical protein